MENGKDLYRSCALCCVPLLSGLLQKKLEAGVENQQSDAPPSLLSPEKEFLFLFQDPAVLLVPDFPLLSLAWSCSQSQDSELRLIGCRVTL